MWHKTLQRYGKKGVSFSATTALLKPQIIRTQMFTSQKILFSIQKSVLGFFRNELDEIKFEKLK